MAGVIKIRGQVYATSRDYRANLSVAGAAPPSAVNERSDGLPCDGTPIPPDSPDSPFRVGAPYYDEHEDIHYRVLQRINVAEGWGTAAFWLKRWGCYFPELLKLVRMGWLDAAFEAGSAVKRYRCRDEVRVLAWLEQNAPAAPPPKAAPVAKPVAKKRFGKAQAAATKAPQIRQHWMP